MITNDTHERSPYWLSPGIDVPTTADILPGMRQAQGLYICDNWAEAAFVPTEAFMHQSPSWRLDVLGDIAEAIERTRQHAPVELFWELSLRRPGLPLHQQLQAFRHTCEHCGVDLPANVEALIILHHQFSAHAP
jgi:hypothetical protein